MNELLQDVRYAARQMARKPGITVFAVLIGPGATARREDQMRSRRFFCVDRRGQASLALAPRAREVTGKKMPPRDLDAARSGHRLSPPAGLGCARAKAAS